MNARQSAQMLTEEEVQHFEKAGKRSCR